MKRIYRHISFIICLLIGLSVFVSCSKDNDNTESDGDALQEVEAKYEQQPSLLKRFLRKYGRKGIREAQKATVGTKNVSKLRKINRYYKRIGRQVDTGGELVDSKFETQRTLKEGFEVFGWHPYYMGNAYESYNFNLLTTIAYFSYDVNPETGSYRSKEPIADWKRTSLIDSAHAKGCEVLLTVTNHGKANNLAFLSNLTAQQNLIDSLISLLEYRNADGVNIDFENIPNASRDNLTRFIKTLYVVLTQVNPKYQVTIALPAYDHTKAFDIEAILPFVERFVIMGYDYHSGSSKKPGPIAPLPPKGSKKTGFNLQNTVTKYINSGLPESKMIMAFPYYGRVWRASDANFSDGQFTESLTYRAIRTSYEPLHKITYDDSTASCYFEYVDEETGEYVECWFDNEQSLSAKYDWIDEQKLRGIGIWALGYDNGYPELWSLIDTKFAALQEPDVKERSALSEYLGKNGTYVSVSIAFLILFMFAGFSFSFGRQQVSGILFSKRIFMSSFIFCIVFLLLLWLRFMDYADKTIWYFFIGIWIGYLIINYLDKLKINTRSNLP